MSEVQINYRKSGYFHSNILDSLTAWLNGVQLNPVFLFPSRQAVSESTIFEWKYQLLRYLIVAEKFLQKCLFTIILAKSNKSSFLRCIISYKPDSNKKSPKESSKRPFNFSRCMVYRHLCLVHNDSWPDSAQCYRMAKIENIYNVLKIVCVISKARAFY